MARTERRRSHCLPEFISLPGYRTTYLPHRDRAHGLFGSRTWQGDTKV
jgi:hypothetical protein